MKKNIYIFVSVILLAVFSALSFGLGAWVAKQRVEKNKVGAVKKETIFKQTQGQSDPEKEILETKKPEEADIKFSEKPDEDSALVEQKTEVFSFAVVGDTQYFKPDKAGGTFRQAAGKINEAKPNFALAVGDLVSSCDGKSDCEQKLQSWKKIMGQLGEKSYPVMGNHDATGGEKAEEVWRKVFNLPNNGPANFKEAAYSFDFGNSHFVALSSDLPKEHIINEEQRTWLERDLSVTKKDNIFVFFHEPAYPVSSKIGESLDVENKERNALWAILEKHKVVAVFNGHEHIHSRKKIGSIYQFGFGNTESFNHDLPKQGVAEFAYQGAHYGLVKVEGQKVTVSVYAVNGRLINAFSFGG